MNTIGERLRTLRLQLGLSQKDLVQAARAYVPGDKILVRESISRIENGRTQADTWTVAALAKALNVSAEYLLGNTDDPNIADEPVYPVPKPDTWAIVRRINDLPAELRARTIAMIGQLLDYASSYSRGMLADVLAVPDLADGEVYQLARSVVDRVLDVPEVAEEVQRQLAALMRASNSPAGGSAP
jgi:transcriptional regulator with XRE-family HTH domain